MLFFFLVFVVESPDSNGCPPRSVGPGEPFFIPSPSSLPMPLPNFLTAEAPLRSTFDAKPVPPTSHLRIPFAGEPPTPFCCFVDRAPQIMLHMAMDGDPFANFKLQDKSVDRDVEANAPGHHLGSHNFSSGICRFRHPGTHEVGF